MTQKETLFYLRSKSIEVKTIDRAYNLVGGHIVHLGLIADILNTRENFNNIIVYYYF